MISVCLSLHGAQLPVEFEHRFTLRKVAVPRPESGCSLSCLAGCVSQLSDVPTSAGCVYIVYILILDLLEHTALPYDKSITNIVILLIVLAAYT